MGPPEPSAIGAAQKYFNKRNIKVTAQESMRGVGNLVFMISWKRAESQHTELGYDTGSLTVRKLFSSLCIIC